MLSPADATRVERLRPSQLGAGLADRMGQATIPPRLADSRKACGGPANGVATCAHTPRRDSKVSGERGPGPSRYASRAGRLTTSPEFGPEGTMNLALESTRVRSETARVQSRSRRTYAVKDQLAGLAVLAGDPRAITARSVHSLVTTMTSMGGRRRAGGSGSRSPRSAARCRRGHLRARRA